MSKWLKNKEKLFEQFKEQKKKETENQVAGPRRSDITWKTPEKGTQEKPKNYQGRLLMDPNDNFYKTYFYHMFQGADNKWVFALCPKTYGMEQYCPLCAAVSKLYKGNSDDKKLAYQYKRKVKHVVNFYIIKDPRDAEAENDEEKNSGKVLVYDCPTKIESKIKNEMEGEYAAGIKIFDPSEQGYDFIVSVGSTKPQADGKVWPDYSNSKFVHTGKALGTDEEIDSIMERRHNLDDYIKIMERTPEDLLNIVKAEMLYELVEQDYEGAKKPTPNVPKMEKKEDMDDVPWKEDEPKEEKKGESLSDDELLKSLEDL